jgi:L-serine dehydratase
VHRIHEAGRPRPLGRQEVEFREREHLVVHRRRTLAFHPDGMLFTARDRDGGELRARTSYSVGAVSSSTRARRAPTASSPVAHPAGRRPRQARWHTPPGADRVKPGGTPVRLPLASASELLLRAHESGLPIRAG